MAHQIASATIGDFAQSRRIYLLLNYAERMVA
jgi:hypothetical protein